MAELEQIWEDKKAWVSYQGDDNIEIYVYRRCDCGKYLKRGKLAQNLNGDVKLTGWICKTHGEVHPYFEFGE